MGKKGWSFLLSSSCDNYFTILLSIKKKIIVLGNTLMVFSNVSVTIPKHFIMY